MASAIPLKDINEQDSIKVDPLRDCIHCKKKLKASAFCFRCNDFLCETCHGFHASSSMLNDHHPHIFSLSGAEATNLTIQKLSSLKEAPRCQAHPGNLSEICCTTCDNQPICIPCTHGKHQGHTLKEVASLAEIQREMLRSKVADLIQYKEEVYKIQEEIRKTKEKLDHNVEEEELKAHEQLDAEEERIKRGIRNTEEELKRKQAALEEGVKARESPRKKDLEKKMKKSREEYELVCEDERREADASFEKLREENKREKERLQEGLRTVNDEMRELLTSLKTQKDEQAREIKELSDHFDRIVKRFETVTTTVDCIHAAGNDWADVQCIPDVCRAIDLLGEDVNSGSQGLGKLSVIEVRGSSQALTVKYKAGISMGVESVIGMRNIEREWDITDIAGRKDGRIAVVGRGIHQMYQIHITVVNMKGDLLQQELIPIFVPRCSPICSFLTKSKIAVIYDFNSLGMYDMRDQYLHLFKLEDLINNWPSNQWVWSITTDPASGNIIVGSSSRNVYVFNHQPKHIKTITLPAGIECAHDIAMHEGSLLVRDSHSRKAFAVTVKGAASRVKYEFTKPTIEGLDWWPKSVCTDQKGYVYMLWEDIRNRSLIVQYNRDGGQIEMMREVDAKQRIRSMTTVQTKQGEKLLLGVWDPFKILVYGVV